MQNPTTRDAHAKMRSSCVILILIISASILFIGCKKADPQLHLQKIKISGTAAKAGDYPCSAGHGCDYHDGLSIKSEEFLALLEEKDQKLMNRYAEEPEITLLLVKEAFHYNERKVKDYIDQNISVSCTNYVCLVFCENGDCYFEEDEKTYVRGMIRVIREPIKKRFIATPEALETTPTESGTGCSAEMKDGTPTGNLECEVTCYEEPDCFGQDANGNIINNDKHELGDVMKVFILASRAGYIL